MTLRRRFKQTVSLEERLAEEAKWLREEAKLLPPGAEREALIRRARQAETGSHMSEWLSSPGLQPPKHVYKVRPSQIRPARPLVTRLKWTADSKPNLPPKTGPGQVEKN
jgi:hypothetical protein